MRRLYLVYLAKQVVDLDFQDVTKKSWILRSYFTVSDFAFLVITLGLKISLNQFGNSIILMVAFPNLERYHLEVGLGGCAREH